MLTPNALGFPSLATGRFQAVTDGFNIPTVSGGGCTALHVADLAGAFSLGGTSNSAAMEIYFGYPTYFNSGTKISGS